MRKSLWIIPVLLLFVALGSTSARADTIISSGGNVTEIDGVTIAGITYNVTFGTIDDMTFATNAANALAAETAILVDLNSGTYTMAGGGCRAGVDAGTATLAAQAGVPACGGLPWDTYAFFTAAYTSGVTPGFQVWAEFAVAPVPTPEPGVLMLTLTGVGLLGLMVVLRKRRANPLVRTT